MARPAVIIDTVPPATPDALPRMDIAAFVGFADAGPVDVPVAIEDLAQFDDLFGAEPTLAFDAESGEPEFGYLKPAVESFLATGGRRCWVVRVADSPGTREYTLGGLARLENASGPLINEPLRAPARSPGIAGTGSIAHTTLAESPLIPAADATPALNWHPELPAPALQLRVAAGATALTPGSLLRLHAPDSNLRLFLVVDRIDNAGGISQISASEWCLTRAVGPSSADDAALSSERLEFVAPALLVISPAAPWASANLRIDALTFEISIWRDRTLVSRLTGLEFAPRHPRFFGNLPDDDALYFGERTRRADRRDGELLALWDEARGIRRDSASQLARRFALGFPADPAEPAPAAVFYLPSAMSRQRQPQFNDSAPAEPLVRSGNEPPQANMFIDSRLASAGGESLRRSAEALHSIARDRMRTRRGPRTERLRGVHALLPVDEVTLVAVPDLVHRRWSLDPRQVTNLLPAPVLLHAAISSGGGELSAEWTWIAEATSYLLQVSNAADFSSIAAEYELDIAPGSLGTVQAQLQRPQTCGGQLYLRVGARRLGEPSPWSNTRFVLDGTGTFERCAQLDVEMLLTAVAVRLPDEQGTPLLRWIGEEALNAGARFEVQSAGDALFASATESTETLFMELPLPLSGDGTRYWRVRLTSAVAEGPWSNTVPHTPPALSRPVLDPKPRASTSTAAARGYDDSTLLEVHRGLLRFCHARGDVLALLGLPRHYGPLDVTNYLSALVPSADAAPLAGGRRLTFGEIDVLSYGALFYPWLAHRVDFERGQRHPRFTPCDGLAAGSLAQVAIERGAWIAAANRPLAGVLSLEPRLPDSDIDLLHDQQVNVLADAPTGFLFIDSETLSRDSDTRSVSVRRLLILLKRMALREGMNLMFEPHDVDLQERVYTDFERVLSRLHLLGAFRGTNADDAFRVIADTSVNSQADIDAGRFTVELRVAPSEPLKFLRVRLTQNGPQSVSVGEL
jgi:hypothetical protein